MKRALIFLCALGLLAVVPVEACFGPKLYLGANGGAEADVLYEMAALYVKEKTGTEMVRVDLDGRDPLVLLKEQKVDLVFVANGSREEVLLAVGGLPLLLAGGRVLEDLRFTTVAPALQKLGGLLRAEQVTALVAEVHGGAPPAAAVRRFLMARGWI
jgi:hypothetical protein